MERVNSVSTPFAEFDDHVGRLIAEQYDHGMLIYRGDSLYSTLKRHEREFNEEFKMKILDGPTSVENLAHMLFTEITELGFRLVQLEVKGEYIYEIFSSGSPFNFDEFKKKKGSTTQTVLNNIDVILHHKDEDLVNLFVRRSFAEHLWSWINDCSSRL